MVGTEPGQVEIDGRGRGAIQRLARLARRATARFMVDEQPESAVSLVVENPAPSWKVPVTDSTGVGPDPVHPDVKVAHFRWRRHPQLRRRCGPPDIVDPVDLQRGARSAAVRGLFLARSGRYDEARASFAAAADEPSLDLTAISGFWDLPRSGMQAAVDAYDDVERFRDAAALGARIRLTYRPRSLATIRDVSA